MSVSATEKEQLCLRATEFRTLSLAKVQSAIEHGLVDEEDSVVRDTLANLMHWCEDKGIDFSNEMRIAQEFFDAEVEGHD